MTEGNAHRPHESDGEKLQPTVMDVSGQRIASVYADALLRAAQKHGQAADVLQELDTLVGDLLQGTPEMRAFFVSGAIGRRRKAETISRVFSGRASDLLLNLLLVLNDNDRLELVRPIAAAYRTLYDERAGRIQVHVQSAVPLAEHQRERLLRKLRDTFRKEPVLQADVNPGLLGGMVVRVGDWLYDQSVRGRLDNIRNQLIERSSYEVQSQRDRFSSDRGD